MTVLGRAEGQSGLSYLETLLPWPTTQNGRPLSTGETLVSFSVTSGCATTTVQRKIRLYTLCVYNTHFLTRTAAEAMVMNPPEPTKEKEKQGFFRAIKKKKKKTQIVSSFKSNRIFHLVRCFVFIMYILECGKFIFQS